MTTKILVPSKAVRWLPALLVLELFLLIAFVVGSAHAQSTCVPGGGVTCTPNYGEWMLPHGYLLWDIPVNNNALITDAAIARSIQSTPTASQQVAQPLGTNINLQFPMVYGSPTTLKFGVNANVPDTSLTRTAAGVLSVDTNSVGNGNGTLTAGGYQLHGAAPLNHLLLGNGTAYVDSATLPPGLVPTPFYQTVQFASSSLPQQQRLNFNGSFTATNNGGNQSTDIGLSATGVSAGTYTAATFSVGADGRILTATSGIVSLETGNAVGCTTGTSTYNTCNTTVTFSPGYGDLNYTAVCMGQNPRTDSSGNIGRTKLVGEVSRTTTSVTIATGNDGSASGVGFGNIQCMSTHN